MREIDQEDGYQLSILLLDRSERDPRGWSPLVRDVLSGIELSAEGLHLWVRSPRLGQLKRILERAKACAWFQDAVSHDITRFSTKFYELTAQDEATMAEESLVSGAQRLAKKRAEAEALRAEAEAQRLLDDAKRQRSQETGKEPSEREIDYWVEHGVWPEALPPE